MADHLQAMLACNAFNASDAAGKGTTGMEDAEQPILDALSRAADHGLRTGFIANTSRGTIVGTVYPKTDELDKPPRNEKVYAVGASLAIQEALQTLNLTSPTEPATGRLVQHLLSNVLTLIRNQQQFARNRLP